MHMTVIGAGLPRTATLSQKVALEMLGLGPCYHMVDILSDLDRVESWSNALQGTANWDEIFAGSHSTVDWPGSFFYRELIDKYPEAKVVLSVRAGDAWANSMSETISGVLYGDTLSHDLSSARSRIDPAWRAYLDVITVMWEKSGLLSSGDAMDPIALADSMERYNDEVKQTVPSDRLLVWSADQGWDPLCEFLEKPVPQAPFPHLNDKHMFIERIIEASLATLNAWHGEQAVTTH